MKKRASIIACVIILLFGSIILTSCTDEEWEWLIEEILAELDGMHDDHIVEVDWEVTILDLFPDLPSFPNFSMDDLLNRLPAPDPIPHVPTPTPHPTDYRHIPPSFNEIFTPAPTQGITDQATAQTEISNIITSLTPEQRQSGDALNIITLNLETVARMGTTQNIPTGGNLSVALLQSSTHTAAQIRHHTHGILAYENIDLLRNLRTNINFISDETEEMQIAFPDNVSSIPFDNVTIESEFAAITLNRDYIPIGGEVNIRRAELDGPPEALNQSNPDSTEPSTSWDIRYHGRKFWDEVTDFSSPVRILSNYWFLLVIVALIIIWLVVIANGERLRGWVIPIFILLALAANVTFIILRISSGSKAPTTLYAYAVEVTMSDGMRATLSLSPNGTNPDYLVLINENGEIQHSRYNPTTGNIDARIRECGIYMLTTNETNFNDINDRSQLMQHAIRQLATRNIMQGTVEGYFYPDDPISRTDVVTTIIYAFDMLDINAQTTFLDVSPHAWYYLAVATAQQMALIEGFRDDTFRGDLDIPKAQLVVMSANTLVEQMGYHVPDNIEIYLERFSDRNVLRTWSLDGIALATASNVLIHRVDGMFAPDSVMTRGDAAIILYRVFSRVW